MALFEELSVDVPVIPHTNKIEYLLNTYLDSESAINLEKALRNLFRSAPEISTAIREQLNVSIGDTAVREWRKRNGVN